MVVLKECASRISIKYLHVLILEVGIRGFDHVTKISGGLSSGFTCISYEKFDFYMPVFRRDVLWYGDVRPGLRPPVFRTFLLHALTYWAEILHMTLF